MKVGTRKGKKLKEREGSGKAKIIIMKLEHGLFSNALFEMSDKSK